jgi:hypothetical protein
MMIGAKMRPNLKITLTLLVIVAAWFVMVMTQNWSRRHTLDLNHKEIRLILDDIKDLEAKLTTDPDQPVARRDLLDWAKINAQQARIAQLRLENALALSQDNTDAFPDFIPIVLLVLIAMQLGGLQKATGATEGKQQQ